MFTARVSNVVRARGSCLLQHGPLPDSIARSHVQHLDHEHCQCEQYLELLVYFSPSLELRTSFGCIFERLIRHTARDTLFGAERDASHRGSIAALCLNHVHFLIHQRAYDDSDASKHSG
jgi:hypothetical protein